MHREILFLSSEVLLRRTEFRIIQTRNTQCLHSSSFVADIQATVSNYTMRYYIYSIFANRANDQLLDSRRQRSEIESESKNI